jgi:hypothetical protein
MVSVQLHVPAVDDLGVVQLVVVHQLEQKEQQEEEQEEEQEKEQQGKQKEQQKEEVQGKQQHKEEQLGKQEEEKQQQQQQEEEEEEEGKQSLQSLKRQPENDVEHQQDEGGGEYPLAAAAGGTLSPHLSHAAHAVASLPLLVLPPAALQEVDDVLLPAMRREAVAVAEAAAGALPEAAALEAATETVGGPGFTSTRPEPSLTAIAEEEAAAPEAAAPEAAAPEAAAPEAAAPEAAAETAGVPGSALASDENADLASDLLQRHWFAFASDAGKLILLGQRLRELKQQQQQDEEQQEEEEQQPEQEEQQQQQQQQQQEEEEHQQQEHQEMQVQTEDAINSLTPGDVYLLCEVAPQLMDFLSEFGMHRFAALLLEPLPEQLKAVWNGTQQQVSLEHPQYEEQLPQERQIEQQQQQQQQRQLQSELGGKELQEQQHQQQTSQMKEQQQEIRSQLEVNQQQQQQAQQAEVRFVRTLQRQREQHQPTADATGPAAGVGVTSDTEERRSSAVLNWVTPLLGFRPRALELEYIVHRNRRSATNDKTGLVINSCMIAALALRVRGSSEPGAIIGYICFQAAMMPPLLPLLMGWEDFAFR